MRRIRRSADHITEPIMSYDEPFDEKDTVASSNRHSPGLHHSAAKVEYSPPGLLPRTIVPPADRQIYSSSFIIQVASK